MPTALWNEETREEIIEILSDMAEPVRLLLFVDKDCGEPCETQRTLLEGLAGLSDKIELEVFNPREREEDAERYAIEGFPTTLPLGQRDYGIRYVGVTGGQEFASLLQTVLMISTGGSGLDPELEALVRTIQ